MAIENQKDTVESLRRDLRKLRRLVFSKLVVRCNDCSHFRMKDDYCTLRYKVTRIGDLACETEFDPI